MRLLALTRYASSGPSSRVRFYQYVPYLTSCGMEIQIAPLLGDGYVRNLYSGKRRPALAVAAAYLGRMARLLKSRSFDLLWIEKELFPWFPAWAETILARRGIPYVVDYDDAVFHRYDLHRSGLVRALLGKSVDNVMRHADTVVVGNDYLAERARRAGASRVEWLPSVVDAARYVPGERSAGQFCIGWIGSPVTAPYLGTIREALEEVIQKTHARLALVGVGGRDPLPDLEKDILAWSEAGEVANIQSFDVGIMPLADEPFERGKCGYKLIQYMACGLPVVASPVGVNTDIIEQGKTGFLASTRADWVRALLTFSQDAGMREKLGKAGRKKVEQEYSLQVTAPRLLEILTAAGAR